MFDFHNGFESFLVHYKKVRKNNSLKVYPKKNLSQIRQSGKNILVVFFKDACCSKFLFTVKRIFFALFVKVNTSKLIQPTYNRKKPPFLFDAPKIPTQ